MKKRRSFKRPSQFTEQDEQELGSVARHIYESIGHDLGKIHVVDFIDCMLGQIQKINGRWYTGDTSRVYPVTEDLKVCRDMEMQGTKKEWSEDPRPGDVAEDVLEAFYHYDNPGHDWALKVVETRMRRSADHRGMLY